MRIIIALGALLLFTGCPINQPNVARVSTDYAAAVKKVGLISLVDLRPNISYLTSSALESNFATAELSGWNADSVVMKQLTAQLQHKGFQVMPLPRSAALLKIYESDRSYAHSELIQAELAELGEQHGLDMIVIVCRHVGSDLATKTNQKIRGYGLQKATDTDPVVYADMYVEAVDVRKHFVVGKAGGFQSMPLSASAWQREFESAHGVLPIASAAHDEVLALMTKVVSTAAAVAAQEAGF